MATLNRRHKLILAATALVIVVGGSAYAITGALAPHEEIAPDTGALAPVLPTLTPEPSELPTVVPSHTANRSGERASRSALVTGTPQDDIEPSYSPPPTAATKLRPPTSRATVASVPDDEVTVTNSGSLNSPEGTMRLVTARADLSGQRELAWVADQGKKYGEVRCSQSFTFSADTAPSDRPTMLICWRTSPKKSVYTVAVKQTGPDPADSITLIDKEWTRLG